MWLGSIRYGCGTMAKPAAAICVIAHQNYWTQMSYVPCYYETCSLVTCTVQKTASRHRSKIYNTYKKESLLTWTANSSQETVPMEAYDTPLDLAYNVEQTRGMRFHEFFAFLE